MKPKILCGKCQKPIEFGSKFCNHCGQPVNWSAEESEVSEKTLSSIQCSRCGAENDSSNSACTACGEPLENVPVQEKSQRKKKHQDARKRSADQPLTVSWKMAVGFIVFLAVAVFGLELLTANKFSEPPHTHEEETQTPEAANMQALQEIESLEQRLSANPNDHTVRLQLANLLHDARFYDRAIQRYIEYLQNQPNDVDARVDLGICYYEVDRTNEAKQQMLKALEYNPKHVLGHFNLGIVHLRIAQAEMTAGRQDNANAAVTEANDWFRKTVALDPNGTAGQRAQRFLADHSTQLTPNPNLLTN